MTGNVLLGFGNYELWPAESDSLTAVFFDLPGRGNNSEAGEKFLGGFVAFFKNVVYN